MVGDVAGYAIDARHEAAPKLGRQGEGAADPGAAGVYRSGRSTPRREAPETGRQGATTMPPPVKSPPRSQVRSNFSDLAS